MSQVIFPVKVDNITIEKNVSGELIVKPAGITETQLGALPGFNPANLLLNANFANWNLGVGAVPDSWVLSGVGATIVREAGAGLIKIGTYSAKLTRVGNNCSIYQEIHAEKGITYWRGRKVTFGAWVYATVADRARLEISDGVGVTDSAYHSGGASWEFLTVTRTIDIAAVSVGLFFQVNTGNTSAYIDGAICLEGATSISFASRSKTEGFGVRSVFAPNVVYQAATDGYVEAMGYASVNGGNDYVDGFTDNANPPITQVGQIWTDSGTTELFCTMTFPVRKGDYWQVVRVGAKVGERKSPVVHWIPSIT